MEKGPSKKFEDIIVWQKAHRLFWLLNSGYCLLTPGYFLKEIFLVEESKQFKKK